jgi:membrane associated rhomboid family serine protease
MYIAKWQMQPLSVNPLFGPDQATLLAVGAKQTAFILNGQYYRLLAPIFLHAGVIHLLINSFMLLRLGSSIEMAFGPWRTGFVYVLSGVFGNILSAVFLPHVMSVGASGALFGFVGSLIADFWLHHKFMKFPKGRSKWGYLFSILLQSFFSFAIGLMPYLDNFCHLGGWIMGFFCSLFAMYGGLEEIARNQSYRKCCVAAFGSIATACLIALGVFLLIFANDSTRLCPWCHYLSCVDIPALWDCNASTPMQCKVWPNGTKFDCVPL